MKKLEFGKNFYEEYAAENGIKEGKATRYYSREILKSVPYEMEEDYDKLREEFSYENGVKTGEAITYFDSNKTNKIWEKFTFVNGEKEGEAWILSSDRVEKRYYSKGKIAGKAIQYFINGKIQENYAGLGMGNDVKSAFRSFKDILGIDDDGETIKVIENKGIAEDRKDDYELFKLQAEKIINEELYKPDTKKENKLPNLFIKKYYIKHQNIRI